MKRACTHLCVCLLFVAVGVAQSANTRRAESNIKDSVMPAESIDPATPRAGGYRDLPDRNGIDILLDPTIEAPGAAPQTLPSSPDDVHWKNDLARSHSDIIGAVRCMIVFDNRLIAGGEFTVAGGKTVNHIAAWDGVEWVPFGTGTNGPVSVLSVYEGKIIAGGEFDTAGGVPVNHIAAWDGTSWSEVGGGTNATVKSLCVLNGSLIAGGDFNVAGGVMVDHVASWNGSNWSSVGGGIAGTVEALIVFDGELIAGGDFIVDGDTLAANLAAWDGTSWTPLREGLKAPVSTMVIHDDQLIVAGYYLSFYGWFPPFVVGVLASWDGASWIDLSGDLTRFGCNALTSYNGQLMAVGVVYSGYCSYPAVYSWNGNQWSSRDSGPGVTYGSLNALAVLADRLIVAGNFASVNGVAARSVAVWDGSNWSRLGSVLRPWSKFGVYHNTLFAEGGLTELGGDYDGVTVLARWDGGSWSNVGPGYQFRFGCDCAGSCCGPCGVHTRGYLVQSFETFHDQLVIGGYIGAAVWDEASAGAHFPGTSYAMTVFRDQLIVAGYMYGSYGLAAWDGESWTGLTSTLVSALSTHDDHLIVGGWFNEVEGVQANRIAMWDDGDWLPLGSGVNSGVTALATYEGQLIAAGLFDSAGGGPANHIAAWDGAGWHSLGDGTDAVVYALAVHNGMLVAGGDFTSAGGHPANHVAAWNGNEWSPLGSGVDGMVHGLTVFNKDLIVSGRFITAGGKPSPYVATWSKRLTQNVAFDVRPGSCVNPLTSNTNNGKGKAVVRTAIMGSADLDVRDIDPASITVGGNGPVRWSYADIGEPADRSEDACACSEGGPDGYEDLTLHFYRDDIVAALSTNADGDIVSVMGSLADGTPFEGSDCVSLVGNHGQMMTARRDEPRREFELLGNVPNPFNPTTRIGFYLPEEAHVKLEIFNVQGQRVTTLIDGAREKGEQWIIWDAARQASGIYFYRIHAGEIVETKRMVLLK